MRLGCQRLTNQHVPVQLWVLQDAKADESPYEDVNRLSHLQSGYCSVHARRLTRQPSDGVIKIHMRQSPFRTQRDYTMWSSYH